MDIDSEELHEGEELANGNKDSRISSPILPRAPINSASEVPSGPPVTSVCLRSPPRNRARYQWPNIIRPHYRSSLISHRGRPRLCWRRIHKKIYTHARFSISDFYFTTRAVIGAVNNNNAPQIIAKN